MEILDIIYHMLLGFPVLPVTILLVELAFLCKKNWTFFLIKHKLKNSKTLKK